MICNEEVTSDSKEELSKTKERNQKERMLSDCKKARDDNLLKDIETLEKEYDGIEKIVKDYNDAFCDIKGKKECIERDYKKLEKEVECETTDDEKENIVEKINEIDGKIKELEECEEKLKGKKEPHLCPEVDCTKADELPKENIKCTGGGEVNDTLSADNDYKCSEIYMKKKEEKFNYWKVYKKAKEGIFKEASDKIKVITEAVDKSKKYFYFLELEKYLFSDKEKEELLGRIEVEKDKDERCKMIEKLRNLWSLDEVISELLNKIKNECDKCKRFKLIDELKANLSLDENINVLLGKIEAEEDKVERCKLVDNLRNTLLFDEKTENLLGEIKESDNQCERSKLVNDLIDHLRKTEMITGPLILVEPKELEGNLNGTLKELLCAKKNLHNKQYVKCLVENVIEKIVNELKNAKKSRIEDILEEISDI